MALGKKFLNNSGIVFFILLSMFTPAYFMQSVVIDNMFSALKMISWMITILIYVINVRSHARKRFNIALLLLWIELLFSTIISKGNAPIYLYLITMLSIVMPILFVEELVSYAPRNGLCGMYYFFTFCILVNTATVFLFPGALYADEGGWRCWILGDDNTAYAYYIIASTIAMIYCQYVVRRTTLVSVCVWICAFVYVFQRGIGTGILCQIAWAGLFICFQFRWFRKMLSPRFAMYITVGAFFVLVVYRQFILEPIVTAVGKDITLTGRTLLWDRVLEKVKQRPIWGYGIIDNETFKSIVVATVGSPHNYALRLLIWGGVMAFVIFALMTFFGCKTDKDLGKTSYYRSMAIGLIVFALRFLVETGRIEFFYMLLAMTAYTKEFVENIELEVPSKHIRFKGLARVRVKRRGIVTRL